MTTDAHDPTPDFGVMKEMLERIESRAAKRAAGWHVEPLTVDDAFVKQLIDTSMTLGRALAFVKNGFPYDAALTLAVATTHFPESLKQ